MEHQPDVRYHLAAIPQRSRRYLVRVEVDVKTVVVHSFSMGDVEDPDLYAAVPLSKWEKSEQGQWVMDNAVETPSWHRMADPYNYGYRYQIRAKLQGPALTEWLLRYGDR
jgi:hypothetical protein